MAAEATAIEADIPMGMTRIGEGEAKALLVRDANGLRAFQANCPHYGAPLAKGEICGHTIYCPWHKAAFDIGDGALVAPPALQGVAQYPIRIEGEKIIVSLEPRQGRHGPARYPTTSVARSVPLAIGPQISVGYFEKSSPIIR